MVLKSVSELEELNVKFEIVVIPKSVHTVEDVQNVVNCSKSAIIKALLFVGKNPVMALIPGDKRADLAKLKKVTGDSTLIMAKPSQVLEITGYKVGTVTSFGLANIQIVADDTVKQLPELVLGSGQGDTLIKMANTEFLKAYQGVFEPIAI